MNNFPRREFLKILGLGTIAVTFPKILGAEPTLRVEKVGPYRYSTAHGFVRGPAFVNDIIVSFGSIPADNNIHIVIKFSNSLEPIFNFCLNQRGMIRWAVPREEAIIVPRRKQLKIYTSMREIPLVTTMMYYSK